MIKTILRLFRIAKNTFFLGMLCVTLLVTVAGLAIHSIQLTTKLTLAATNAAAAAANHRKAMAVAASAHRKDKAKAVAKTKAREKAKARIRRFAVAGAAAVPMAGMLAGPAIAGSFEVADFNNWKTNNPEGGFADYACETGEAGAELVDEVLRELPEPMRPHPDAVREWIPQCGDQLEDQPWEVLPTWDEIIGWVPSFDGLGRWLPSPEDVNDSIPNGEALKELLPTEEMQELISRFKRQISK
ncbi:MAG: hypothetical protein OXH94_00855 [Rhodospirillales bacterium]|nr:hypothetical protein [Rhodospirillales bacterium]